LRDILLIPTKFGEDMVRKLITAAGAVAALGCVDSDSVTAPGAPRSPAVHAAVSTCSAVDGQQLIDAGQYAKAIKEFTCLVDLDPTAVEGYRGRIEAQLLLGKYSDAVRDYVRVNAFVVPVHPDAEQTIVAAYDARLAASPNSISALTGQSFAHWWFFNYPAAIHVADQLVQVKPNDVYGNLFRGSSRVLHGGQKALGLADLEQAIALAPASPDVRYVVADAYTYGAPDPQRAFDEATRALNGGLNTPRVRAILGASYNAFGDLAAAAAQIKIHLDMVTTSLVATSAPGVGASKSLAVVPGRTYELPLTLAAGERLAIATSSKDFFDTILVLLAPNGTPVVGADDTRGYFAGLDWVAPAAGTYRLRVSSFEAASTGLLTVARN
jgi:tetratricopeptide (TPR) repeat protein